jgi:thiol-disulfide isomerase/thioredoxin
MKKVFALLALLVVVVSCVGQQSKKANATEAASAPKTYPMPKIPAMLTTPEDIGKYVAEHYWDAFDFADTTLIGNADYTEQAFVDYTQIVGVLPPQLAQKSIAGLFQRAAVDKAMFWHMAEIAEKYFFDPNSPFRNDELYIMVLEGVLANPSLDEWERIRPQEQLRMQFKNRAGTPATDFTYTLASGAEGRLYGIKAPYTLLFFNNPGCHTCKETIEQIEAMPYLSDLIEQGQLVVLAIYPDEDLDAWKEYNTKMPASWINSYDKELVIKNSELYDLKAIPTLYLLDKNKTVMLRDETSVPRIVETLYNEQQK